MVASLVAMFAVGAILLLVFAGYEWRVARCPIMPRRLLNRNYTLSLAILTSECFRAPRG